MVPVLRKTVQQLPGSLDLFFAACLFISPWVLGFTGETAAAWTAWLTAIVIAGLALAAIVQTAEWEEWAALVLGAWLVMAPWIVGFATIAVALWTHVVIGILVAALSVWELWSVWNTKHNRPATA